jgi:hypothetical protein
MCFKHAETILCQNLAKKRSEPASYQTFELNNFLLAKEPANLVSSLSPFLAKVELFLFYLKLIISHISIQ